MRAVKVLASEEGVCYLLIVYSMYFFYSLNVLLLPLPQNS